MRVNRQKSEREKEREKVSFATFTCSYDTYDTRVVRQYIDRVMKIYDWEQGPFDNCASGYWRENGRKSCFDMRQLLVRQIQYV